MLKTTGVLPTRLLLFGMVAEDGTLDVADIGPVAAACGQSPEQIRSCLRRLVTENILRRVGTKSGTGHYELTPAGFAVIAPSVEKMRTAYATDRTNPKWDRRWHLAAFAVPEARRSARAAFRDRLGELGGAAIQGGLYVSATDWRKDVRAAASDLGIHGLVTTAAVTELAIGGESGARPVATRLWDLKNLAARYFRFVKDFTPMRTALEKIQASGQRLPDTLFLPAALGMALAFDAVFAGDPLLPTDLLPSPWPGRDARYLVAESRQLALALREKPDPPALFRLYDEVTR